MNTTTAQLGLALIALLSSGSLGVAAPQEVPVIDIPLALRNHAGTGTIHKGLQAGVLRTSAWNKQVIISWKASVITNLEPDWSQSLDPATGAIGTHRVSNSVQEISRRYFPTASARLGSDYILVAGMKLDGSTIIESIKLNWPDPMPAAINDIQSGLSQVHVVSPNVGRAKPLYADDVTGRRGVSILSEIRRSDGPPNQFLVVFEDSKDIYIGELSGDAQGLSLLASASNDQASLGIVPVLYGDDLTVITVRDHKTAGIVYKFTRAVGHYYSNPSPTVPTLLLVDADQDGGIESFLLLSDAAFKQQGYGVLANYNEWWLN